MKIWIFKLKNGMIIKYRGNDLDVTIHDDITEICITHLKAIKSLTYIGILYHKNNLQINYKIGRKLWKRVKLEKQRKKD